MVYPLVRELAGPDTLVRVPMTVTCRVLGFSNQACYKWCARPCSKQEYDDAYLINPLPMCTKTTRRSVTGTSRRA